MHSAALLMRWLKRLLQVDGAKQYCRLLCKEGVWRGPFCGPDVENRKVTEYLHEYQHLGSEDAAGAVYRPGCQLPGRPELELHRGHRLLLGPARLPHGARLTARCADQRAARAGPGLIQAAAATWPWLLLIKTHLNSC